MASFRGFGQHTVYGTPSGFGEPRKSPLPESTSWHGVYRHSRRERERQHRPGGTFSRPTRRSHRVNTRQERPSRASFSQQSSPRSNNNNNICIINGVRVARELVDFIVEHFDDGVDCDDICEYAASRFPGTHGLMGCISILKSSLQH